MLSLSLAGTVGNHTPHRRAVKRTSNLVALGDLALDDTVYSRQDAWFHGDGVVHAIL